MYCPNVFYKYVDFIIASTTTCRSWTTSTNISVPTEARHRYGGATASSEPARYDDFAAISFGFLSSIRFSSANKMTEGIELRNLKAKGPTPPPRHPDTQAGGSLGKAYRLAEEKAKAVVHLQEGGLDNTSIWGCASAIWYVF